MDPTALNASALGAATDAGQPSPEHKGPVSGPHLDGLAVRGVQDGGHQAVRELLGVVSLARGVPGQDQHSCNGTGEAGIRAAPEPSRPPEALPWLIPGYRARNHRSQVGGMRGPWMLAALCGGTGSGAGCERNARCWVIAARHRGGTAAARGGGGLRSGCVPPAGLAAQHRGPRCPGGAYPGGRLPMAAARSWPMCSASTAGSREL